VLSAALYAFGSGLAIAATKDQWEEEILIQLSELRKAQGELVKQVADLKTEIQTLHASAGPQPAAALSFDLRNNDFPVLGDRKAEVAIVEFSDFECPYCGRHQKNTIPALVDKYVNGGKVKYVFVAYPLGFHSHAESAAVAAACAGKQNAFWKMHDLLFENQNVLSEQLFLKTGIGLETQRRSIRELSPRSKSR